ncbi:MAG: hypothetical protein MJE77_20460, partial [Proteobacteria bacterium]|nr:hypothetical protein [Pseudomonadota bacterium]
AQRRIDERGIRGETVFAPEQPPVRPSPTTAVESFIPPALLGPSPAAVVAEGQRATDDRLVTLLAENTSRTADALEATANRPIQVRMEVDGDVLAEHTVSATRRQRARSFGPP